MNQLDITAKKLSEMLKENTGRHFLDSGGCYGRHWEQNQGINFEKQPEGKIEWWNKDGELEAVVTISVYHFLKDRLEYNLRLDEQYQFYAEEDDLGLNIESAESFVKTLDSAGGIYGEGEPFTVNTYNGDDLLSQVIQYVYWIDKDGAHVMLQIHGGCDVRGGYTEPVVFDVVDDDGISIFDNAKATIYCEDCYKHWDTNDGYHWAPDGCWDKRYKKLEEYPAVIERPEYLVPNPNQRPLLIDEPELAAIDMGVIWIDDDHNGHCPCCGGVLKVRSN